MIRRPPRSTRTDTLFPSRRSSDLKDLSPEQKDFLWKGDENGIFKGIDGFFKYLQEKIQKIQNRIFLARRSEEHTSELQSLMRISYAVFCLKKKKTNNQ